jgi:hypothetical protein
MQDVQHQHGAITLNATGGVAPLTFAWTGPGGFTSTSANITALASGSYHTVTDVNGCTLDQDIAVGQATNTITITSSDRCRMYSVNRSDHTERSR